MSDLIRIPKVFYDDCVVCDCEVIKIEKQTKAHYWIDVSKDADGLKELLSRAELYADLEGLGMYSDYPGLVRSARATLKALENISLTA